MNATPVTQVRPVILDCSSAAAAGVGRVSGARLAGRLLPARRRSLFTMQGWHVWCGTAVKGPDGRFYLLFSRWPQSAGHDGWVTHSEIAVAVSDSPEGPYRYQSVVLAGAGGDAWDAQVTHNPTVLNYQGKYYLYYMGNHGTGEYWNNRNNQRVGLAVADHPMGPWRRLPKPVLDVTPGSWDCLMVSNPSVCVGPGGGLCMIYKGVGAGQMPKGGAVVCGAAFAERPEGPWRKHPSPVIRNPDHPWAVEDPFIWSQGGRYYCIVKDFQGYFSGGEQNVLVLMESEDAINWLPTEEPLFMRRQIAWESGVCEQVEALERPQLMFGADGSATLLLAGAFDPKRERSFNLQLSLAAGGGGC